MDAFVSEIVNAQTIFEQMPQAQIESFAQEYSAAWFQEKAVRGVSRLPASDQRHFFALAIDIMRLVPADFCAGTMRNTVDSVTSTHVEARALAFLDDTKIARYLSILRRSVAAEISDDPLFIPLSPSEKKIAEQIYEQRFVDALLDHPRSEQLIAAAEMNDWTPDRDVCDFSILALEVGLVVEGAVGDWVIRLLLAP